jgi:hypothetical protein
MATVRTWPPLEDGQEHENLAAFGANPQERHAMAVLAERRAHRWPSYRTWPPLATYGAGGVEGRAMREDRKARTLRALADYLRGGG